MNEIKHANVSNSASLTVHLIDIDHILSIQVAKYTATIVAI